MIATKIWTDAITLMTVHSSKGLEFKQVFVVGMEEDLFPSQMMMQSREDLEEERRLFYVATTRANGQVVFHLRPDQITDLDGFWIVSRVDFLEEVEANCIKVNKRMSTRDMPGAFRSEGLPWRLGIRWYQKNGQSINRSAGLSFTRRVLTLSLSNTNNLQAQQLVGASDKFGFGKVQKNWNRRT